jgi:ATP-binding cassette subfamily B protein
MVMAPHPGRRTSDREVPGVARFALTPGYFPCTPPACELRYWKESETMKLLWSYLRRYRGLVGLTLLLAAINQTFSLLDPLLIGRVIDKYVWLHNDYTQAEFLKGVGILMLGLVGVAFVSRVAKNFQDYFINVITLRLGSSIYADGVRHSLDLPYAVFEDQRSGETLGKLQKVRTDVEKVLNVMINVLYQSAVAIVFVMVFAFYAHWIIAVVYFTTVPVLFALSSLLSRKIKTIQKRIVAETTALAGSTTESLRNIELVKSLGLAGQEIGRLNGVTSRILELELEKVRYVRSLSFIQGTAVNALRTSILFLMMYLIYTNRLTPGQFLSLFIYSFFVFGPLQEIGNVINVYREAEVSLNNFNEILSKPKEPRALVPQPSGALEQIAFDDVVFRHQTGNSNALDGVSFNVSVGETIAFVGPSGSGKTTLVKLLVGLYRPKSGDIRYNGVSINDIDLDALRAGIGMVSQDTQLFSGTIRENLLFVNPSATDADCMEALRKAACQSLLARAEKGLDSVIGEGGVKVSGGEKQRLSIARALLRRPRLLVFDEATSSLDSLTEEEITVTIRDVSTRQDMISILIAHRLSTVLHADRIYVLERGQIAESGRHEDLLELKGLYYAMWRQQIGERTFREGKLAPARA